MRAGLTRAMTAVGIGLGLMACVGASPASMAESRDGGSPAGGGAPPQQAAARPAASSTFDSARALDHLRRQVAFGPRPSGSAALKETRQYIVSQLKAAGITAREDAFAARTPAGEVSMV